MDESSEKLPPPATFDTLRAAILMRRSDLPKRLTQVAAYALDNPNEIAFRTASSIAVAANVQPSTLVRFAQLFGYDGFSSMQRVFRERLRERTSTYEERLRLLEGDGEAMPESLAILNGFINAGHRSLDVLRNAVEPAAFDRAVGILANARTIFLIAKRRTYPISSYMAYAFGKLRVRCIAIGTTSGIDDEVLALAEPEDAAFAVSFSPYASESANQARAMADRGVPLVSLTDSAFSPLAECSSVWFEVAESDHAGFRSLSASMAFAMALTVCVAEKRRQAAAT